MRIGGGNAILRAFTVKVSKEGKEDLNIRIADREDKEEKSELNKKRRNRNFPENLPRDEIHHELLDSELDCECGGITPRR